MINLVNYISQRLNINISGNVASENLSLFLNSQGGTFATFVEVANATGHIVKRDKNSIRIEDKITLYNYSIVHTLNTSYFRDVKVTNLNNVKEIIVKWRENVENGVSRTEEEMESKRVLGNTGNTLEYLRAFENIEAQLDRLETIAGYENIEVTITSFHKIKLFHKVKLESIEANYTFVVTGIRRDYKKMEMVIKGFGNVVYK